MQRPGLERGDRHDQVRARGDHLKGRLGVLGGLDVRGVAGRGAAEAERGLRDPEQELDHRLRRPSPGDDGEGAVDPRARVEEHDVFLAREVAEERAC